MFGFKRDYGEIEIDYKFKLQTLLPVYMAMAVAAAKVLRVFAVCSSKSRWQK